MGVGHGFEIGAVLAGATKLIYRIGLGLDYLLVLPSLWYSFAGIAAFAWGAHSIFDLPTVVLVIAMPLITIGCLAMAINLDGRGQWRAAAWAAWTPVMAVALAAGLFAIAQRAAELGLAPL
jgi:hypothetical protein